MDVPDMLEKSAGAVARERVKEDLENLTRDAEALLKATADNVSDKARDARARVASALERAKVTCAHLQEQTVAKAKVAAEKADAVIREHPYESIGMAFGIGLLIGVLVSRK